MCQIEIINIFLFFKYDDVKLKQLLFFIIRLKI